MENTAGSRENYELKFLDVINKFVEWLENNKHAITEQAMKNLPGVALDVVDRRVDIHYGRIFSAQPFPCGTTLERLAEVASAIPGAPVPPQEAIDKLHEVIDKLHKEVERRHHSHS